jgi:hypothetical protein
MLGNIDDINLISPIISRCAVSLIKQIKIDTSDLIYKICGTDDYSEASYIVAIRPTKIYNFIKELYDPIIELEDHGSIIFSMYGNFQIDEQKIFNICRYKNVFYRHINLLNWSNEDLGVLNFTPHKEEKYSCPICFEDDDINNGYMCYVCRNFFHKECFKMWKSSCALCRNNFKLVLSDNS